MKQKEHELIVRILDGDDDSYGILIDRYKQGLYNHCFRFMRDEDAAEDIVQQAFIQAFVKLKDFDRVHAFSTWLYKIATRLALDELRRKRPVNLTDETLDQLVGEYANTEQRALDKELHNAIKRLPSNQRRAVVLHYFKGKRYQQIADEMNTTPGSVKVWIYRAKQQLKEMLS